MKYTPSANNINHEIMLNMHANFNDDQYKDAETSSHANFNENQYKDAETSSLAVSLR